MAVTHRIQIQPIRVKKEDGTTAAAFGGASEAAYIQQQVNRIWAQVGVRVDWLPFTEYTSDFAYQGSGDYSENPRPASDLEAILNGASSPPKSSNAVVINLFFVGISPGAPELGEFSFNGRALLDANGVALYVGEGLLDFEEGLDAIAVIVSHEVGHNLGLVHYDDVENLMNTFVGSEGYLTNAQKSTIFTNNAGTDGFELLQVAPPASNYAQWAATHGLTGGPDGDDDKDKIENVIEFMLSLNPKASSSLPVPVRAANGLTWTLQKNAAAVADGLVYQAQSAGTLSNSWLAAGTVGSGSTVVTNNSTTLVVRLDSGGGRRFMRLNVDSAPVAPGAPAAAFIPLGSDPGPRVVGSAGCGGFLVPPEPGSPP